MGKKINPIEMLENRELSNTLAEAIRQQLDLPPSEKTYLLLLVNIDDDGDGTYTSFEFITGRDEAYKFIRDIVVNEDKVHLEDSLVLANGCLFEQTLNFIKFLQIMKERYYQNDDFDIDEYI